MILKNRTMSDSSSETSRTSRKTAATAEYGNVKGQSSSSPQHSPTCMGKASGVRSVLARRRLLRRRPASEDELLKSNRKHINACLRKLGSAFGKELALNGDGVTYFPYKRFIIVVEVPDDNPSICILYTMVCNLGRGDNVVEVMKLSMELNYLQMGTRGATLGLDGSEVNLCFSIPVVSLNPRDLKAILEDFMSATVSMNRKLEEAKALP